MSALTSISIYNDLTTGKTCISMRTTNHELTCRVYEVLDVIIEESQHLITQVSLYSWNQDIDYILTNLCQHSIIIVLTICLLDEIIMLGRNYDGIDALWDIIV